MRSNDLEKSVHRGFGVEETWRNMVEDYSNLRLKEPKGRLLAIGGVAQQVQAARPGDRYLAGLWQNSLHWDLLWGTREKASYIEGPTWSWASWCSESGNLPVSFYLMFGSSVYKPCVEIVEATCRYENDNPFGKVRSGRIVLRGCLLDCLLIPSSDSGYQSSCEGQILRGLRWPNATVHFTLPSERHFLLEMGVEDRTTPESLRFYLVLHKLDEKENIYDRRGLVILFGGGKYEMLSKLGHITECVIT